VCFNTAVQYRALSSVFSFPDLPLPAKVYPFGNRPDPILCESAPTHMPSSQLPNYLLSNRKRLSLSQAEVAFLLGNTTGSKVSRYEHFDREPSLETALALEVIFQRSASELFNGIYQRVEAKVIERAKLLAEQKKLNPAKHRIFNNIANKSLN
jgi:transcriptional regulator with XRE-family HTH domain